MMRTTLNVDRVLLDEATQMSGEKSPSDAVNEALAEYVKRRKIEQLRALRGKLSFSLSWQDMERLEMEVEPG